MRPLRIAQVAPVLERVPPVGYGGTERIVHELVRELDARGHQVTTFASGDSDVPGEHVVTVPRALRPAGIADDPSPWMVATASAVLARAARGEFDVIHSHLELLSVLLAGASPVPVVATFHGRIDHPALAGPLSWSPARMVAISAHQASTRPEVHWSAVIHNGLTLSNAPFERRRDDALVFVGRVSPEKGILDAIAVAQKAARPLRIAAKVGPQAADQAYYRDVFKPALDAAGSSVEFMGELDGPERDLVVAASHATIMPGAWPEPFGLVAIESLACGTPVLARRVGALPEIIREGVDGFFGDDIQHLASLVGRVDELDREGVREGVLDRFDAGRMTDGYEDLFRRSVASADDGAPVPRSRTAAPDDGRPAGAPPEPPRLAARRDAVEAAEAGVAPLRRAGRA